MKREMCFGSKVLAVSGILLLAASGSVSADSEADVLARIRPIGHVVIAEPAAAPAKAASPAPTAAAPAQAASPAPTAAAPAQAASPAPTAAAPAAAAPTAAASGKPQDGKTTFEHYCFACHLTGVANAPKFGDKAAWAPRIAKGMDALLHSAINGVPGTAMPPRGTCATCTDADLKAAIEYMVSHAK